MGSYTEPSTLQKPWIETPLIESNALSKAAGCRIFLKLENLQPSSSFKSRGIGNLLLRAVEHHTALGTTKPLHFYSSSGGNAGLACVTAARSLGYPATVVVPMSTDAMMIAKIKAAGATEVIQKGASWMDADTHLRANVMGARPHEESIYCPPFDHPDIWAGASSMVDEMRDQLPGGGKPDALICSVGGGGLLSGIAQGMRRAKWTDVPVLAMETQGAHSLNAAVQAGELVTLPGITSVATCLGAVRVAQQALDVATQRQTATGKAGLDVRSVVLSDAAACMGCWRLADDHRFLVEPACGVSVAPCYLAGFLAKMLPGLTAESRVVIVLCGGSGVTLDLLRGWRERFEGELGRDHGMRWDGAVGGREMEMETETGDEGVPSSVSAAAAAA